MRAAISLWASAILVLAQSSVPPPTPGPTYAASSIVNAASGKVDTLAPNTIATVFGTNLSYVTRALMNDDVAGGLLPTALPGASVGVTVRGLAAPLLYVSPTQVNFLVPAGIPAGTAEFRLTHDGRYGPVATIRIAEVAPALFQADPEYVVAARASDGSVVTRLSPATPGEVILLFGTGLGRTTPSEVTGHLATSAAWVSALSSLVIEIGGVRVPSGNVLYAGLTPGFAGLYQINVRVPEIMDRDPEIRIGFNNEVSSPAGVRLPAQR